MKNLKSKLGFTLIELLVVITIIGILATGAVSVFTTQIQKARDSTRLTDGNALRSSIEQYYQDLTEYPTGGKGFLSGATTTIQTYLPKLPRDPKDGQSCNGSTECGYAYMVSDDSNGITAGAYELSIGFENSANKEQKAAKDGGNDPLRFELSIGTMNLDTAKPSSGNWGTTALNNTNTDPKIHIGFQVNSASSISISAF